MKDHGNKAAKKKTTPIKWQLPMKRVLIALVPIVVSSVYFFGWRALLMVAVCNLAAFLTEYAFARVYKEPVTSAAFVTGTLFAMAMPPPLPIWMAVVGVVVGIMFGKMVFGGFGKNVFNPALTGRAFIYVSFGAQMTGTWSEPYGGVFGGLGGYLPDAITGATPGMLLGQPGTDISIWRLVLGHTAGTLGGTSAILALLGGLYLVRTKAANYRIPLAGFAGYFAAQTAAWLALGGVGAGNPLRSVFAGNIVFGLFFYATDPVSAPKTDEARWLYGAFIGAMSSVITVFAAWPAGTMFSILLANMFAPITDHGIRAWKKKRKAGGKT